MPRKPNYRFERAERERRKDERRAKREERRSGREEEPASPATPEQTGEGQES